MTLISKESKSWQTVISGAAVPSFLYPKPELPFWSAGSRTFTQNAETRRTSPANNFTAAFDFLKRNKYNGKTQKRGSLLSQEGFGKKRQRGNRLSDMKRDVEQTGICRGAVEGNFWKLHVTVATCLLITGGGGNASSAFECSRISLELDTIREVWGQRSDSGATAATSRPCEAEEQEWEETLQTEGGTGWNKDPRMKTEFEKERLTSAGPPGNCRNISKNTSNGPSLPCHPLMWGFMEMWLIRFKLQICCQNELLMCRLLLPFFVFFPPSENRIHNSQGLWRADGWAAPPRDKMFVIWRSADAGNKQWHQHQTAASNAVTAQGWAHLCGSNPWTTGGFSSISN